MKLRLIEAMKGNDCFTPLLYHFKGGGRVCSDYGEFSSPYYPLGAEMFQYSHSTVTAIWSLIEHKGFLRG